MLRIRELRYSLRGTELLQKPMEKSNTKRRCLSVKGVDLWNSLLIRRKSYRTINGFKKRYKLNIMEKYRTLEWRT